MSEHIDCCTMPNCLSENRWVKAIAKARADERLVVTEAATQHQCGDYNGGMFDWGCNCGAVGHWGDGVVDSWPNHLREVLSTPDTEAARQAIVADAVAKAWPAPTKQQVECGWEINADFLHKVKAAMADEYCMSEEEVECILLTATKVLAAVPPPPPPERHPKFRVGQIVRTGVTTPSNGVEYARIARIERNEHWAGGFRYIMEGQSDISENGFKIGLSEGMLHEVAEVSPLGVGERASASPGEGT